MRYLLLSLVFIPFLKCFASPFDTITNDIAVEDQDLPIEIANEEILHDNNKSIQINFFKESDSAKVEILDIRNGIKSEVKLTKGDKQSFKDISLRLDRCRLEIDKFYTKISVASMIINGKRVNITNDYIVGQYLIKVICGT